MIGIRATPSGVVFAVRVHPRARKTAITGILGEGENAVLKLALAAPPVDGRANEAVVEFFADLLDVPRSSVQILSGEKSRAKVIRVAGRAADQVAAVLAANL